MFFRDRSRGFRTAGFFKSYFILGILGLSIVFFLYSNWVTRRLKRETAEFSMMLAHFAAQFPSIEDKETSDAAGVIIDKFKIPFIVTDAAGRPIIARGIGSGLREKILANTLTPEERQKLARLIANMDKNHSPIPMKGVMAEEGRKIIGYIYYDETKWSLNEGSSFVMTDVAGQPVFWHSIDGGAGRDVRSSMSDIPREKVQSFVEKAKERGYSTTVQFNPPPERAYFHYGSTGLIHQLRWWMPLTQMTMVATFLIVALLGYQRIKHDEQQAIWAGLAKETAHQLGTPISSLMGWLEILEERGSEGEDEGLKNQESRIKIYEEMQSDVRRLNEITARFGEVGSVPKRVPLDVSETIHNAVAYFQRRLPHRQKHVEIIESHQSVPKVEANENLLQWVIENLIRNSLDAIDRDDGRIHIRTEFDSKRKDVLIIYKDNGRGIPRKHRGKIFLPGYSSKKHGWGLGLAIVKRIIEGYHGGRVKIAESGSEGSTFIITLPAKGGDE